ncbi:hypothetical protein GQ457_02G038850 [Hibiscus cannabinus]
MNRKRNQKRKKQPEDEAEDSLPTLIMPVKCLMRARFSLVLNVSSSISIVQERAIQSKNMALGTAIEHQLREVKPRQVAPTFQCSRANVGASSAQKRSSVARSKTYEN